MRVHELKTAPRWFEDVRYGYKGFEVRRDDRDFHVGDRLRLREYADGEYTGRVITVSVDYILRHDDFPEGIMPGYCVLQIGKAEPPGECNTTTNGKGMDGSQPTTEPKVLRMTLYRTHMAGGIEYIVDDVPIESEAYLLGLRTFSPAFNRWERGTEYRLSGYVYIRPAMVVAYEEMKDCEVVVE